MKIVPAAANNSNNKVSSNSNNKISNTLYTKASTAFHVTGSWLKHSHIINREYFIAKIFLDSLAYAKQGHLPDNHLFYRTKYFAHNYSPFMVITL